VWEAFRADGHLPCSGFLSCWGHAEPDHRPALLDPRGPSWQLDRPRFDRMLRDAAAAAVGATVSWRLAGVQRAGRRWLLRFTDGAASRHVVTDFVVDATGRRRSFARLAGIRQRADQGLVCVAGLMDDPDPHDASTVVETAEYGWWYASRIPGGLVVAALFTDAAGAAGLRATTPQGWQALLPGTRLVRARIRGPDVALRRPLRTAAAGGSRLERCGGRGWLAVGDAACAHDPLSSRGLHDALAGGLGAARCVGAVLDGEVDAPLREAARTRTAHDRYRRDLAWFYGQERRFGTKPFWRRRVMQ
jgi:flavin-dependent dehydrogenase